MIYYVGQKVRAADMNPGAWQTITLAASWVNRAGYSIASYRLLAGGNSVQVVLNISGGTTTNDTTIFTLASGFRPLATQQVPIIGRIASAPQQNNALKINTDGTCNIFDIGASATLHANFTFPIDI